METKGSDGDSVFFGFKNIYFYILFFVMLFIPECVAKGSRLTLGVWG